MELNEALSLVSERVRGLSRYHLEPRPTTIKLNQNENPNDWPLSIKEEIAQFCKTRPWNQYPNFVPDTLKQKLSDYTGVPAAGILVGNGSNEMLLVLLLALLDSHSRAIICQPTFTIYGLLIRGLGGAAIEVRPNEDLSYNLDRLCEAIIANPKSLLILCSPNNPTGSVLSEEQLRKILSVHKGFFILDQAYVEFGGFNAVPLLREYPNLIITRTFSKAMAGAGLRLGYMLGRPEIIDEINKIKLPYNINFFSERVAETLLGHIDYVQARVEQINGERDRLYAFFKSLPLDNSYPSCANFLLIRTKKKRELFEHLAKNGILVRDVSGYPMLENCLRINAGTPEENRVLQEAMRSFFEGDVHAYTILQRTFP
jgi:histidinol-phosphate aminotransferase